MESLNTLKNRIFFFSFGLGLASTIGIAQPNNVIKEISKTALGFSIAGVVLGEFLSGKAFTIIDKNHSSLTNELLEKQQEINVLSRTLDKNVIELNNFKTLSEKAENELQQALNIIKTREIELIKSNQDIKNLREKLSSVGEFSANQAYVIVRDTYNRSVKKLECHVEALIRNYQPIADELHKILVDVDKFKNRWNNKLNEYESIKNFNDLLDTGLDFQQKIIEGCIELRVRGQQVAIKYLNNLLEDSVAYAQYEQDIHNLQSHAGQTVKQLRDENEAQVRAIVSDWVAANQQHIEKYQTDYTELIELGKETVAKLAERDEIINHLQSQLIELENQVQELSKPWQFPGTIDYARAGNAIINFYHAAYGYILDAIAWEEIETGYSLTFATNRNKIYLTADMLEDKDNLPQLAGLTNALSIPKFTPNYQSGLIKLDIQTRQATKKTTIEKLEADINKVWIPASKFESFVKSFERVRITAGSTGGKSPTAKNLALAIMNTRKGKGEIKLYDPQHGSKKDFWNMPKSGTSHDDNLKGVIELCKLIDERRNGRNHEFTLFIFDEVDNTVSNLQTKQRQAFKDALKIAIKEGSHCNIGAIFIGQSADANEIPGMTHSNWNNCVQIHIGSNAGIALDKLTTVTNEDKTRLLEQYRKIQEYCERKNTELGLDVLSDATALRFALVVPLTGLPKFIQLPDYDSYEYSDVMSINTQNDVSSNNLDGWEDESKNINVEAKIVCPNCGSTNIGSKGTHYHRCNDCAKTWKRKTSV